MFHDRFAQLRAELRQLLATAAPGSDRANADEDSAAGSGSVEEFARKLLDEDILVLELALALALLAYRTRTVLLPARTCALALTNYRTIYVQFTSGVMLLTTTV